MTVAVVGLGASGRAAARLALERGGEVYATDREEDAEVAAGGAELRSLGARVELGRHDVERIADADAVVVSPGIPPDAPVLRGLQERGAPWISELEFAFRFLPHPLIAVTGTNGKTTTAALTAHLLTEAGFRVGLGGNIGAGLGPAASDLARMDPPAERVVVEASSFQLADVEYFAPDVGMVTNLAPDHLDRYPSVDAYYADKARLFDNATDSSAWVLNGDDEEVLDLAAGAPGRRHLFRIEGEEGADAFLRDDALVLREEDGQARAPGEPEDGPAASGPAGEREGGAPARALIRRSEMRLLGRHNAANGLAAALAARLVGADTDALSRGLRSFEALPHRLEPVGEVDGVLWVDDSKATNVSATLSAVESLDRPLVLLLGGKDKGEDFRRLRPVGGRGVRRVIAYGAARERITSALEGAVAVEGVDGSFEDAVESGAARARPGEILLLSPACSSYDMFDSYRARGRRFRELAGGEA